jgi:hypothetical protein
MLDELHRRNYAASTIAYYVKNVEQFARYLKRSPDRLAHTHLWTYQAHLLRQRKLAPRTAKLHVCVIRFFFNKILQRRYLLDDTPYPKVPRRLPQILSHEEVSCLIAAAHSLTHRTMLMLLYSTGIRNAELRHLRVQDIDSRRMVKSDSDLSRLSVGINYQPSLDPFSPQQSSSQRQCFEPFRVLAHTAIGSTRRLSTPQRTSSPTIVWNTRHKSGRGPLDSSSPSSSRAASLAVRSLASATDTDRSPSTGQGSSHRHRCPQAWHLNTMRFGC